MKKWQLLIWFACLDTLLREASCVLCRFQRLPAPHHGKVRVDVTKHLDYEAALN
jgi:hypothetical protein